MKLIVAVCTATLCVLVATPTETAFLPISLSPFRDLTAMDNVDLAYLRQQYDRPKRSGSGDIIGGLKSSLGQGIKSKLGMIGKASGHFSSGSSHYYHEQDMKPFDVWTFKKSVLYTLLQAVKAIKGGVIAIKGQLIKGGGQLLATKGKIIKGGGEALSNLGKSIATSAFMLVPQHEDHEEHYEYAPPTSYGHSGPELYHPGPELHHSGPELHHSGPDLHHHSGPEPHHSAPSGPGQDYGPAGYHKYNSVYDGKHEHHHQHDGIVILKKIPTGHDPHQQHHLEHAEESKAVEFKPMKEGGEQYASGVKNFMGSVFSASSTKEQERFRDDVERYRHTKDVEESQSIPATSYGVPVGPSVKYLEYFNTPSNTVHLGHQKQQMFVTPTPGDQEITYKLELPKNQQTYSDDSLYKLEMPSNQAHEESISYKVELPKNNNHYFEQPRNLHQQPNDAPIIYKLELPKNQRPHTDVSHSTGKSNKPHIFIGMHLPVNDLHNADAFPEYSTDSLVPTPYSQQAPTKFFINYPDPTDTALRDSMPLGSRHVPKKGPTRTHKVPPVHRKKPSNFEVLRSVGFELRPDRPFKL